MDKKDKIFTVVLLVSIISNAILVIKENSKNNKENTKVVAEVEDKYFVIKDLIVINRSNKYFILNYNKKISLEATEINGLFTWFNANYFSEQEEASNSFSEYTELIDMLTIDEIQLVNNQGGNLSLEQLNNICLRINEEMSLQQEEGKSLKLD